MALPVPLIRRIHIITKYKKSEAISEDTAKTLSEAGVLNPNVFPKVTDKLVKDKVLIRTKDNKYYLNK